MLKYVFDTNVFITLQRIQPIDLYPSVWEKISELMEEGYVISSHEVFDEITVGDDELVLWVKTREKYFVLSSEDIQQEVREILKSHRELVEGGKKKNSADPFVIAVAKQCGGKVVTTETLAGKDQPPKIPNVCSVMQIACIDFVSFQREMKLKF
jgi:hypothetical protein